MGLAQQLHHGGAVQGPRGRVFLTGPLQICWRWALSLWLGFSFSVAAEAALTLVIDPGTCSLGLFGGYRNSPFL